MQRQWSRETTIRVSSPEKNVWRNANAWICSVYFLSLTSLGNSTKFPNHSFHLLCLSSDNRESLGNIQTIVKGIRSNPHATSSPTELCPTKNTPRPFSRLVVLGINFRIPWNNISRFWGYWRWHRKWGRMKEASSHDLSLTTNWSVVVSNNEIRFLDQYIFTTSEYIL